MPRLPGQIRLFGFHSFQGSLPHTVQQDSRGNNDNVKSGAKAGSWLGQDSTTSQREPRNTQARRFGTPPLLTRMILDSFGPIIAVMMTDGTLRCYYGLRVWVGGGEGRCRVATSQHTRHSTERLGDNAHVPGRSGRGIVRLKLTASSHGQHGNGLPSKEVAVVPAQAGGVAWSSKHPRCRDLHRCSANRCNELAGVVEAADEPADLVPVEEAVSLPPGYYDRVVLIRIDLAEG